MTAAVALPIVLMLGVGAIELATLSAAKADLQAIADASALAGAREITADDRGLAARVEAMALTQAQQNPKGATITAEATVNAQERSVAVTLNAHRPSFFGNLLPPGGFRYSATATAGSLNVVPLCVMAHGRRMGEVLSLKGGASIEAAGCMVHANDRMAAMEQSRIVASLNQAVGLARGAITAAPQVGARPLDDPFAAIDAAPPGTCFSRRQVFVESNTVLSPGLHCDDINVIGNATLTLAAGEHYFSGARLVAEDNARLTGTNVVLVFDRAALDLREKARVSLQGRHTGRLAGFLILARRPPGGSWCGLGGDRDNDNDDLIVNKPGGIVGGVLGGVVGGVFDVVDALLNEGDRVAECTLALGSEFVVASDQVDRLDGVIYVPAAKLTVVGGSRIAESSDWTVMVAERIEVKGSPRLIVKSNYASSRVPAPDGVTGEPEVRLVK